MIAKVQNMIYLNFHLRETPGKQESDINKYKSKHVNKAVKELQKGNRWRPWHQTSDGGSRMDGWLDGYHCTSVQEGQMVIQTGLYWIIHEWLMAASPRSPENRRLRLCEEAVSVNLMKSNYSTSKLIRFPERYWRSESFKKAVITTRWWCMTDRRPGATTRYPGGAWSLSHGILKHETNYRVSQRASRGCNLDEKLKQVLTYIYIYIWKYRYTHTHIYIYILILQK